MDLTNNYVEYVDIYLMRNMYNVIKDKDNAPCPDLNRCRSTLGTNVRSLECSYILLIHVFPNSYFNWPIYLRPFLKFSLAIFYLKGFIPMLLEITVLFLLKMSIGHYVLDLKNYRTFCPGQKKSIGHFVLNQKLYRTFCPELKKQ